MRGSIEETNPAFVFECFDLKCDGRVGNEKAFRVLPEIQMFGNGAKDLETKVFQLGHVMIIHGNELVGESIISHPRSGLSRPMTIARLAIIAKRRIESGSEHFERAPLPSREYKRQLPQKVSSL